MGPVARFADSLHNVVHLFASPSHPILHTAVLCFVSTLALFAGSYLSRRGSWHRMFWAAAPPLIVVSFGTGPGLWNPRQWALVVAVWIWAARHALNLWWRRDTLHMPDWLLQRPGAAGGEPHWLASLLCFHLYPAALLSLLCVPMYYAMSPSACTGLESRNLTSVDVLGIATLAGGVWLEGAADLELSGFLLKQGRGQGGDPGPEASHVCQHGLWSLCRHPNYLGEVLYWVGVYLVAWGAMDGADRVFGVHLGHRGALSATLLARHELLAWAALGWMALFTHFFFIAIPLAERRQLRRRGAYQQYRKDVRARLVPGLPF